MHSNTKQIVDFVIITALEEEFDAVKCKISDCEKLPPLEDDIRVYFKGKIPINGRSESYEVVLVSLLNMGHEEATSATRDVIRTWHPRYVILVGIAGGIASEGVNLGDVIVSNQIANYNLEKVSDEKTEIRWRGHDVDQRLLGHAQHLKGEDIAALVSTKRPRKGVLKRHIGPIASGNKVIAKASALAVYQETWAKLKGVEMEGGGVALAALQSGDPPGFFMIRGVSDHADSKKNSTITKRWRTYACDVAATYMIALLQSEPVHIAITRQLSEATQESTANPQQQTKASEVEILDDLILDINFEKQVNEAKDIITHSKIASFLIHGETSCGQIALLKRLLKFCPNQQKSNRERIKVTINSRSGQHKSSLWDQIYKSLELEKTSVERCDVPKAICEFLKTRDVIIVFENISLAEEAIFLELVTKFWQPIVEEVEKLVKADLDFFNQKSRLLLFLIDHKHSKYYLNSPLICHPGNITNPALPIGLSPIVKFQSNSIKHWVPIATNKGIPVDELDDDLYITDLLSGAADGLANLIYEAIYRHCEYSFQSSPVWLSL